ncbi:hypothetical protein AN958_06934 [Leucoagaricus sp. SymC.cos]|nr:hypothetical protein AN958_06934 [Leucoagaricus sp. SymC.cos]
MSVNPVAQSPSPGSPRQQSQPQPASLHPEIRSIVSLTVAHAHKIYFSGPLIRRIERQPDGQKPSKDEGWTEVWAQLGGTTLSIWDMKEIQEASRQGKEVPPTYVNVTDAFVQVLGSVTVPATATQPSKRYTNVLTLNTAGSNLLLFSCPSTNALISWASALRLSAWEKSRLEEIYTAHLIRITLNRPNAPSSLIRGKMEGWARIRVAGQTDWKRVWMVVSAGHEGVGDPEANAPNGSASPAQMPKKKRMSNLFSREQSPQRLLVPAKPVITMYAGQKPKERKKVLLSFRDITQAFAVYPERPELINKSTLIKVEGLLGDEEIAQSMKSREGWILFMPEIEGATGNQAAEMLKWIIAIHDAFDLYGRPTAWTWDPREPISLMFAYPIGPQRDLLFLDREAVEALDPRDDRTSAIRSKLLELLSERMRQQQPQLVQPRPSGSRKSSEQPPTLPPISSVGGNDPGAQTQQNGTSSSAGAGPQLPPLNFSNTNRHQGDRMLTPITEGGSTMTHGGRRMSLDATTSANVSNAASPPQAGSDKPPSPIPLLDRGLSNSPGPALAAPASPRPTSPTRNVVRGTSISSGEVRPSAQSVKSSSSIDRVASPVVSIQNQAKPPLPRASTSASVSSQANSTTKIETPSISVSASASGDHYIAADRMSVLTSPHSIRDEPSRGSGDYQALAQASAELHAASRSPPSVGRTPPPTAGVRKTSGHTHEPEDNFLSEAGALYFMHQSRMESGGDAATAAGMVGLSKKSRQVPMPTTSDDDEDEEENSQSDEEFPLPPGGSRGPTSPLAGVKNNTTSRSPPPRRQGTPMAFMDRPASTSTSSLPPAPGSPSGTSASIPLKSPLEEEEEEDDDEDADSDVEPMSSRQQGSNSGHMPGRPSVYGQFGADGHPQQQPPHLRAPRTLPQPPASRPGPDDHHTNFSHHPPPRRLASDQFSERRTYYDDGTQIRTQSEFPPPGAARQTVWSQVLDPGKNVNPTEQQNTRDTFVQLEPSETMTKAFTPQGLLSAGIQDKQDRSAKRQEELARETGASLINVPNKPPPPQTGLLGAITAHERERKRDGGVGAALTEREREKRLAEERQRRFDEQQRQQMEQMQQGGGSMYGGYGFNPMVNPMMMGMNPMMMNPMMTGGLTPMMTGGGMNPMMTGGGMNPMMGYPGMLNAQQMYAAQHAAAAAYQQAMMAFSTAGSQAGGEHGGNQQGGMPMGQNMTGGNMGGFDPRMSMMGMSMMGGMGGMPGMGGMSGMSGMGMQPTMSGNFDTRFPPGTGNSPSGGSQNGGLLLPTGPTSFSSQTNSPIGRGSPLARPADASDRPGTPKH